MFVTSFTNVVNVIRSCHFITENKTQMFMTKNQLNTYIIQEKGTSVSLWFFFLEKIKYFVFSALNLIRQCVDYESMVSVSLFNSQKPFKRLSIYLMSTISSANDLMLLILYYIICRQHKLEIAMYQELNPEEPQLIQVDWVKFCH